MDNTVFEKKIFGKKTYGDFLKEIYTRNCEKDSQIKDTLKTLNDLIDDGNLRDALMALPSWTALMKTANDNDELLIKMTAIIQKNLGEQKEGGIAEISDSEREQLLRIAQEYSTEKMINDGKVISIA